MDTPILTDYCTRHRSLRATQSICQLAVGTDLHFNSPCTFIPVEVRPADVQPT